MPFKDFPLFLMISYLSYGGELFRCAKQSLFIYSGMAAEMLTMFSESKAKSVFLLFFHQLFAKPF